MLDLYAVCFQPWTPRKRELAAKMWSLAGDFPGGLVVKTSPSNQEIWVRSLVGELKFHRPHGPKPKIYNRSNIVNSRKTLNMVVSSIYIYKWSLTTLWYPTLEGPSPPFSHLLVDQHGTCSEYDLSSHQSLTFTLGRHGSFFFRRTLRPTRGSCPMPLFHPSSVVFLYFPSVFRKKNSTCIY